MFDLAIVGSGYGGAVLAGRLASSARVLLVERGLRYRAGEFPSSSIGLARRYLTRKNPLGLWEMRLGKGTGNALVSAYGGASVVNYGITSQPERHVFDDWPIAFSTLEPYFERAKAELGASINPVASELGDQQFLDRMEPGRRVDLENTIDWTRCTQCGDCPLGCNLGAKRSLDTTYLARAEEAGVTLALGQTLVALTRDESDTHWRLSLRRTDGGTPVGIEARRVVLASGTFGTLDLLNSWRDSLPTTAAFGQRVSMNGDGLAFLYNTRHRLSGHHGAPITTSVRLPFIAPDGSTRSLMVMSGRIPKSIMRFSSAVLAVFSNLLPGQRDRAPDTLPARGLRRLKDLLYVGKGGALSQTYMYKLDGQDAAKGTIGFDAQGRSAVDWPDYTDDPVMVFARERLAEWAQRAGGRLVTELGDWPLMKSFGVHPLGGCRMGTSPKEGVVDPLCRVYRPDGSLYPGLRIVDASVLPGSLGVPSSLTIAALAEYIADDLRRELEQSRDHA